MGRILSAPPAWSRATATNAPGVSWVHGWNIGLAESSDGGATWTYRGPAAISYGKDTHPNDFTYWAPEVIWHEGTWRMWYKDERAAKSLCCADSPDLYRWEPKGSAVTNFNGEGPKVIHWKGKYWLIADCWQNGMRVWHSDDCLAWNLPDPALLGSHGNVVVSGDRAWWFYFGGPR